MSKSGGGRTPFTDLTNNPQRVVDDENQKRTNEEQERRAKKAKYMRDYRARKKAEANMVSCNNPVLTEAMPSPALAQEHGQPVQKDGSNLSVHGTFTPQTPTLGQHFHLRSGGSTIPQSLHMRNKENTDPSTPGVLTPQTPTLVHNSHLGTGVSTISQTMRMPNKENIDPDDPSDWLHRNDNYIRRYSGGAVNTTGGSSGKDKLIQKREKYNNDGCLTGYLVMNFVRHCGITDIPPTCIDGDHLRIQFLTDMLKYQDNECKENIPIFIQEFLKRI